MSDIVKVALIQGFATIFAAMLAATAILYGAHRGTAQVVKAVDGIVTKLTDSKDATIQGKDDMIAVKNERLIAIQTSAHAEGVLEEKDRQEHR